MKKLLLLFCLIIQLTTFCQTTLKIPFNIKKLLGKDSTKILGDATCKAMQVTILKFVKQDDDSYQGVFLDDDETALESFNLIQSAETLFYEKLRLSIKSLCELDKNDIDTIIKTMQEQKLYTKYLEAKEGLANAGTLAGILTVHKVIPLYSKTNPQSSGITTLAQLKLATHEAIKAAKKYLIEINKLSDKAFANAKNAQDSLIAFKIKSIGEKIKTKVDSANSYVDSIKKSMPDTEIFDYYSKALRAAQKSMEASSKAILLINTITQRIKTFEDESDSILKKIGYDRYIPELDKMENFYLINPNDKSLSDKNILNINFSQSKAEGLQKGQNNYGTENPASGNTVPNENVLPGNSGEISNETFTIHEIQIQFQDGFIENIKVFGIAKGTKEILKFENSYPIPFSTGRSFRKLIDFKLFEKSNYRKYGHYFLNVGDILSYNQEYAIDNKDYSPANQILTIKDMTQMEKPISLYKDQTSRILEARIFSDLKGTDGKSPNGLIQIDLARRFNFLSQRHNFTRNDIYKKWHLPRFLFKIKDEYNRYQSVFNYGFFNYITPYFSLNKVEENEKRLILSHADNLSLSADGSRPITYASTINLLRHQSYKIGVDLSLLYVDLKSHKSTLNFGMGVNFGRTSIQDTLKEKVENKFPFVALKTNNVDNYGINTFQWGPFLTFQLFPDSRFGFSLTQRFTWFKALTDKFEQVRDSIHYTKYLNEHDATNIYNSTYSYYNYDKNPGFLHKVFASTFSLYTKCISSSEIYAFFNASDDGKDKIFFRYRLNWDLLNAKDNFQQLQVGFSTCINATKEFKKLKLSYDNQKSAEAQTSK